MIGPVVHGPPVMSKVMLIGQAPGPREGTFGRPFAWTAGKTLFKWFEKSLGVDEETFRSRVYIAAVARCFPGKAKGGGDRPPDEAETEACSRWLVEEVELLKPDLLLPVGAAAIESVLGHRPKLKDVVGVVTRATFHGHACEVIPLPHPSGASTWHRMEPGQTLLVQALQHLKRHPVMKQALQG